MVSRRILICTSTIHGGHLEKHQWPILVVLPAEAIILAPMRRSLKATKQVTKVQRCFLHRHPPFGKLDLLRGLVGVWPHSMEEDTRIVSALKTPLSPRLASRATHSASRPRTLRFTSTIPLPIL